MLNEVRDRAFQVALPVPEGTLAGAAVKVGALVGVALTDRGTDTPGESTVKLVGSFSLSVKGVEKENKEKAIAVGDKVYIDAEGKLSANDTGTLFGYALEAVAKGETKSIEVKIATP
jgi:predicted RecA/RadA family phage recombinase